ncbi:hypothetical protein QJQ45_010477 [Haematococcus lacustris]|nr:hypothetical protein QJQ45_010477 [Haematococcus lacustris]
MLQSEIGAFLLVSWIAATCTLIAAITTRLIKFCVLKLVLVGALMPPDLNLAAPWISWQVARLELITQRLVHGRRRFAVAGFMRIFVGMGKDRLDGLMAAPTAPPSIHLGAVALVLVITAHDACAMGALINTLAHATDPAQHASKAGVHTAALLFSATLSPMAYARHSQTMTSGLVRRGALDMSHLLLVAFDLAVILVDGAKTLVKYGIYLVDLWLAHRAARPPAPPSLGHPHPSGSAGAAGPPAAHSYCWEGKGDLLLHVELVADLLMHALYLLHYLHIWHLHGPSLQLVDAVLLLDIRAVACAIIKRLRGYMAYRAATHCLRHAFQDSPTAQLRDNCCSICMDPMTRAKQLPCGHHFHLACLRAWVQHQGHDTCTSFTCPNCRCPMMVPQTGRGAAPGGVSGAASNSSSRLGQWVQQQQARLGLWLLQLLARLALILAASLLNLSLGGRWQFVLGHMPVGGEAREGEEQEGVGREGRRRGAWAQGDGSVTRPRQQRERRLQGDGVAAAEGFGESHGSQAEDERAPRGTSIARPALHRALAAGGAAGGAEQGQGRSRGRGSAWGAGSEGGGEARWHEGAGLGCKEVAVQWEEGRRQDLIGMCSAAGALSGPAQAALAGQGVRSVRTDNLSRHFAQIGAELDAVLEKLKAPQQKTRSPEPKPQKVELADEQVLFCDENGCVLLDKSAKQGAGAAAQAQSSSSELDSLLSGHGWVLGVSADTDPEAATPLFGAVVGGNGWTVSLTQAELQDFIKALQSIRRTVRDMLLQGINPSAGTAPVKVKKSSAAVQAFKAALTTGRDRAAAKRKEQMEDPATVTQFAAVFYLLKLGRPMTDIEHTPDLLRSQFAEVKRDAANSPGMGISQLWQSLSKQPITALEIFEYGRLAELAMVMVPGSGEEERMFSAMAYLKDDTRNRLNEEHLNECARAFHTVTHGVSDFPYHEAIGDHFELSFRVGAGRAVHATWAADVVGEVLDALDLHSYGLGNGQLKPQEAAIV